MDRAELKDMRKFLNRPQENQDSKQIKAILWDDFTG
jgi:hypothetical protein